MKSGALAKVAFVLGGCVLLLQLPTRSTGASESYGVDVKSMDTSVMPCDDFYKFANGSWLAHNPIPADRASWGAGGEVQERNYTILHEILENAARNTSAPKGSIEWKVGTFYRIGMDEKQIEAEGAKPLKPEFDRISAIKNATDLISVLASHQRTGVNSGFGFFVNQDLKNSSQMIAWLYQAGLGLPDRDYYTSDEQRMKEIRAQYVTHVAKMFELLGDGKDVAARNANTVMALETEHGARVDDAGAAARPGRAGSLNDARRFEAVGSCLCVGPVFQRHWNG